MRPNPRVPALAGFFFPRNPSPPALAVIGAVLAAAGALKDRRATTHHNAWEDLGAAGATLVRERVVDDGDRVTAGGVTSGIDLALHLVERFAGKQTADLIADNLEYRATSSAC